MNRLPNLRYKRHADALQYALTGLKNSSLCPYVKEVYLYGSCARGAERWNSDIDLFINLDERFLQTERPNKQMNLAIADMSLDGIYDVETDVHFIIGDEWKDSNMTYYRSIRKDGIQLWS